MAAPAARVRADHHSVGLHDAGGQPTTAIDNAYLPLAEGTTFTYDGVKDATPLRDVMTVDAGPPDDHGVSARVVLDTAYSDGILIEDTFDWYAQDDLGNVWYFGEDTASTTRWQCHLDVRLVEAGVGGNLPGIVTAGAAVGR